MALNGNIFVIFTDEVKTSSTLFKMQAMCAADRHMNKHACKKAWKITI